MKNQKNKNIYNGKIINLIILMGLSMAIQGSYFSMMKNPSKMKPQSLQDLGLKGHGKLPNHTSTQQRQKEDIDFMVEILKKYQNNSMFVFLRETIISKETQEMTRDYLDPTNKQFDFEKIRSDYIDVTHSKDDKFNNVLNFIASCGAHISEFLQDEAIKNKFLTSINLWEADAKEKIKDLFQLFDQTMTTVETKPNYMFKLELLIRSIDCSSLQTRHAGFVRVCKMVTNRDIDSLFDKSEAASLYKTRQKHIKIENFFSHMTKKQTNSYSTATEQTTLSFGGVVFIKALLKEYGIQGELKLTDSTTEAKITAEDKVLLDQLMVQLIPDLKTSKKVGSDSDNSKKLDDKVLDNKVVDAKKEGNKSFMEKNGLGLAVGGGLTIPLVGAGFYASKSRKAKNFQGI